MNLLTGRSTRSGDQIGAHDAAVLEIVRGWLENAAFEEVKPSPAKRPKRRSRSFASDTGIRSMLCVCAAVRGTGGG